MPNYLRNAIVLNKMSLKIINYFLHPFCLWLIVFLDI